MFVVLLGHYQTVFHLSHEEAYKRAEAESKNSGLELFRNHSCYSLKDTALADQFVAGGGTYGGVPASYVPCFTPRVVFSDVNFHLMDYHLPPLQPTSSKEQIYCRAWDHTASGGDAGCEYATFKACFTKHGPSNVGVSPNLQSKCIDTRWRRALLPTARPLLY
jgi:hypothetical protein